MNDERLLINAVEAARRLAIGRSQLYKLIRQGELRTVRIGRSRRIPVDALREYVARLVGR